MIYILASPTHRVQLSTAKETTIFSCTGIPFLNIDRESVCLGLKPNILIIAVFVLVLLFALANS